MKHHTDIRLGDRYRDTISGFEGAAASVHFYPHGVERVTLKTLNTQGALVESTFDAPDLRCSSATSDVGFRSTDE